MTQQAKYEEAEREVRDALSVLSAAGAADNPYLAAAEYALGEVLLVTDRCTEAESVLTSSVDRWKNGGFPAWRAARSTSALGEATYRQGRIAQGEQLMNESFRALATDPKADPDAVRTAKARVERYLRARPIQRDRESNRHLTSGPDR